MRRECEGRDRGPGAQLARAGALPGAKEEDEGERCEQDEEGIRSRLLRVPDEQRMHGGERCRDERRPGGDERPGCQPRKRNGRRAEERRERAESYLARAEELRPHPGQEIVERWRRLALGDRREHVAKPHADEPDGVQLVVAEALKAERREAKRAGAGREACEHQHVTGRQRRGG
jgi:hypothetical protein